MKVLFDHHLPFALAHGGFEQQLLQTKAALESIGVETDYVHWWDSSQSCDLIHFAGRPNADYITFAHKRGWKVVIAELLTGAGSRSASQLRAQKLLIEICRRVLPGAFTIKLAWDAYDVADACIANTDLEARLMNYLFNAPKDRIHIVPNGVEDIFMTSRSVERGKWLVCTATIAERKRILELSQAAVRAQTPLWIIGRPYSESDPYFQKFIALAKQQPEVLRYEGPVSDRANLAQIYREARGFVLLSVKETRSLSSEEAAACECPLLLADLPWAHSTFGAAAKYCPVTTSVEKMAPVIREFYEMAPSLKPPPKPASWNDVACQLKAIYAGVLNAPRQVGAS